MQLRAQVARGKEKEKLLRIRRLYHIPLTSALYRYQHQYLLIIAAPSFFAATTSAFVSCLFLSAIDAPFSSSAVKKTPGPLPQPLTQPHPPHLLTLPIRGTTNDTMAEIQNPIGIANVCPLIHSTSSHSPILTLLS